MSLPVPEACDHLHLPCPDPIQHDDEVIRPIVLFAERGAAGSTHTGIDRSTVGGHARRFVQHGMLGLVELLVQQSTFLLPR